jgi:hypothetical protein
LWDQHFLTKKRGQDQEKDREKDQEKEKRAVSED